MASHLTRAVHRSLTLSELELVRWLVSHGEPEAAAFAGQIDQIRVTSECTCGCPSIMFATGTQARPVEDEWIVIADVVGTSPEGYKVNVLLHAHAGMLHELEVFTCEGQSPFALPRPQDLKAWEDAAV